MKKTKGIRMFGLILTSVVTLLHLYVFWRVATLEPLVRRVPVRYVILAGVALWLLFLFGRLYAHGRQGLLAGALEHLAMNWMGILFLCFFGLVVVELLTGFGWFWTRHAPLLRGLALGLSLLLAALALLQGARPPEVSSYEVRMPGLPAAMDGTVAVALSDLHISSRVDAGWLAERVDQVLAEKPDLVFLLGDIFEGHDEPSPALRAELTRLRAPLGVWAVLGNHEFYRNGGPHFEAFTGNGFHVLRNASVTVGEGLVLAGVDDLTNGLRDGTGLAALRKTLAERPAGPAILLSHSPLHDDVAAGAGVGLMLSGHTHGGQLWPFGYLTRRFYPLLAGRYLTGAMDIIVCRGTGTWGPRMRLWQPGEMVRVTLRSAALAN